MHRFQLTFAPNPTRPFSIPHFLFTIVTLTLAFTLSSCGKSPDNAAPALQLQVISSHNSDIRREFSNAFSAWHLEHFGAPVEINWPDIGGGGTGNIVTYLNNAYASHDSSGDDVVFGGGSAAFNTYAKNGFLVKLPALSPDDAARAGWPRDPLDIVPKDIFSSPLHGGGGNNDLWTAATMSTFGMAINKDRIAELHRLDPRMTEPRAWADIAGPQWFGCLSLADPSKSGSVKTSYEMILQSYGWEKGWSLLVQIFANAPMIRESGANPADDAANADAVAGIGIDFYCRLQISRVGPRIAGYVIPQGPSGMGGTAIDADPIAFLKGAPHAALAARFIRFVVSPEGQRLWIDKPGVPGGPKRSALGRLSVLPDLYQSESANLVDPNSPFTAPSMLKMDAAQSAVRNGYLGDLLKAALIDNHDALVRTRRAIKDAGDPPELLDQLTALPTFRTSQLQDNQLVFSDPQPLTVEAQSALKAEYSPPKGDPRPPEQLQTALKDFWRTTFAQRFAQVESAARRR